MAEASIIIRVEPDMSVINQLLSRVFRSRRERIDQALEDAAMLLEYNVAEEAPKKTRALSESIRANRTSRGWEITEGVPYGRWVREGTRPRQNPVILPLHPMEALWWPGLDRPRAAVYAHPGNLPNPYHERAVEKAENDIDNNVLASVADDLASGNGP